MAFTFSAGEYLHRLIEDFEMRHEREATKQSKDLMCPDSFQSHGEGCGCDECLEFPGYASSGEDDQEDLEEDIDDDEDDEPAHDDGMEDADEGIEV